MDNSVSIDEQLSSSDIESEEELDESKKYETESSALEDPNPLDNHAQAGGRVNGPQRANEYAGPPHKDDVLLGRGKPYQNYSGNRRMLRIVSQFKDRYNARPRDQKRSFVNVVLDEVLKDGTRFLRKTQDSDGNEQWEEVDRSTAAEKVWHVLRFKEGNKKKKQKLQADSERRGTSPAVSGVAAGEQDAAEDVTAGAPQYAAQGPLTQVDDTRSMVESLTAEILQHLSNATAAANLLATITSPQQQQQQQPAPAAPTATSTDILGSVNAATNLVPPNLFRSQFFPPNASQPPPQAYNSTSANSGSIGAPAVMYPGLQMNSGGLPHSQQFVQTNTEAQPSFNMNQQIQAILQALATPMPQPRRENQPPT